MLKNQFLTMLFVLSFGACTKNASPEADFPVYPNAAFLQAGEGQVFRFPFEEIEGPRELSTGFWDLEEKSFRAPSEISQNQRIVLSFGYEDLQTSVEVFLLSEIVT